MAETMANLTTAPVETGETRVLYQESGSETVAATTLDISFEAPVHQSETINAQFLPFSPVANDSKLFVQLSSHDLYTSNASEQTVYIAVDSDAAREFFQRLDARVVDIVCENCTRWFHKTIPTETIRRYCQPSLKSVENRLCVIANRRPVQPQQQAATTPVCQFSLFDMQDDALFAKSFVPLGGTLPEPHRWETRTDLTSVRGTSATINLRLAGLHFSASSCEPVLELSNLLVADNLLGTQDPPATFSEPQQPLAVTNTTETTDLAFINHQDQSAAASDGVNSEELALQELVLSDLSQQHGGSDADAKQILVTMAADEENSECADSTVTGDEEDIHGALEELFSPETIERATVYSDLSVVNRERVSALMRLAEYRMENLLQTKVDLKIVQQESAKRAVSGKRASARFAEEQRVGETLQHIYHTLCDN